MSIYHSGGQHDAGEPSCQVVTGELLTSQNTQHTHKARTQTHARTRTRTRTQASVAPGSAIITAGTRHGPLSFIESGVTAVSLRGRQVATLEAGDICGEIAMLSGEVHTCDVTALSACKLLQVQPVHMMQLAQAYPELLNRLTVLGNERLRRERGLYSIVTALPGAGLAAGAGQRVASGVGSGNVSVPVRDVSPMAHQLTSIPSALTSLPGGGGLAVGSGFGSLEALESPFRSIYTHSCV